MAGELQLTEEQRKKAQADLKKIREQIAQTKRPPTEPELVSWQQVTDAINTGATDTERVTQETVRKMGELGVGGVKVARLVKKYFGEADVPQHTEHRFPSKFPVAAALRGIYDDEAIEAMLVEDHKGSTEDPGEDFWHGRVVYWHDFRRAARPKTEEMPAELATAPPLQPRPKKIKRGGHDGRDGKGH